MKPTRWRLLSTPMLVLGLTFLSGVPALAKQDSTVDVHQLANRVRKVIKLIEDNTTIPCETRNHFVKRLRTLDDALESGDRSGARALVIAWRGEAGSYQGAGLLSAAHGSILHNGLQGFLEEIGTGAPEKPGPTRKWEPLAACNSGGTSGAAAGLAVTAASGSSYDAFDPNDVLVVVRTLVGMMPAVGPLLSGVAAIFWPSSGNTNVSELIDARLDDYTTGRVTDALDGLRAGLSPYDGFLKVRDAWLKDCAGVDSAVCKESAQNVYSSWDNMRSEFVTSRREFQTLDEDYQLMLLPLFAQYETLYLSFLREGILLAPAWIASGKVTPSQAAIPADIMAEELDPDFVNPDTNKKDRGIAYVNLVYNRGLDAQPQPSNWDDWKIRNRYIRDYTLKVVDFRNTWKFFDPAAYPDGVEGGIKLPRMIYSDPIGHMTDDAFDKGWFQPPPNVAGPLTELTVWAQRAPGDGYLEGGSGYAVSAIQSTNPPTAGPARSGVITGDATHDGTTGAWHRDLRVFGPINEVWAYADRRSGFYRWVPSGITFGFAAGGNVHAGGYSTTSGAPDLYVKYPGHVLGAAGAMGRYDMSNGYTTDAVIFGFRLYDSFFPSGALVNVRSGKCMDVRYLTAGTQPTIYSCFGGPGQIWTYDTNTKAVTIGDPDLCLKAAGTTAGSAVVIDACTGAKNQQWELVPRATGLDGLVKLVDSELVLDVVGGSIADRTPIVLWYPSGDTNQQWTVTSPLKGEVHGAGSGRCLDVRGAGTANGTPVQIYDCSGGAPQAWTYDESAHTLSVYNGTKCLDAPSSANGAELRIWDCTGASNQTWVFNRDGTIGHLPDNGIVLDVESGSMKNERPVILAYRNAERTSQRWSRPSRRGGNVHATNAGKCLDLPNLYGGTQAQIHDCLAAPAPGQEWTYHPLTQRLTAHGDGTEHCLSATGTASGAAVVVNDCTADPNQLWILKSGSIGGTIVNAASGLCMTLAGTGTVTANLAKVELRACTPANPNQQWIWP